MVCFQSICVVYSHTPKGTTTLPFPFCEKFFKICQLIRLCLSSWVDDIVGCWHYKELKRGYLAGKPQ